MHRSVLQNKDYIRFSEDNTVEVILMSGVETAASNNDPKAARYTEKSKDGAEAEYMLEFPGLTLEQMAELNKSGATKYSARGIPYTAIVNPHTLDEMEGILGGCSAGTLMDKITAHKKALQKEHGRGLSRREYRKIEATAASIREAAAEGDLAKALRETDKFEKSAAKLPKMVESLRSDVLGACEKKLDELEAALASDDAKNAAREIGPLARALAGTPLEERANALFEKSKA